MCLSYFERSSMGWERSSPKLCIALPKHWIELQSMALWNGNISQFTLTFLYVSYYCMWPVWDWEKANQNTTFFCPGSPFQLKESTYCSSYNGCAMFATAKPLFLTNKSKSFQRFVEPFFKGEIRCESTQVVWGHRVLLLGKRTQFFIHHVPNSKNEWKTQFHFIIFHSVYISDQLVLLKTAFSNLEQQGYWRIHIRFLL